MNRNIRKVIFDSIYWNFNPDRVAEKKIKKSIELNHKGGFMNSIRSELLWYRIQKKYSASYAPSIIIGNNLRIEHCLGSIIGSTTVIGDNVRIYQHVNIIAKVVGDQERINNNERRHAKIGNNVILGAGCTIIGPIVIGNNCIIGAGAIVTRDIPDNSVIIGTNTIYQKKKYQTAPNYLEK